jgi:hypothetical protein
LQLGVCHIGGSINVQPNLLSDVARHTQLRPGPFLRLEPCFLLLRGRGRRLRPGQSLFRRPRVDLLRLEGAGRQHRDHVPAHLREAAVHEEALHHPARQYAQLAIVHRQATESAASSIRP